MPPLILIPLADDNSDRLITPYVTYLLILFNVMTFIILQDMNGASDFTMAFSTVPEEIIKNKDVVTENRYLVHIETGDEIKIPGASRNTDPGAGYAADFDVHARRLDASAGEHAVSVDLRRQHRR